jgi:ABC-type multidrug transport system fused ATPase/permease subunit
VTRILVTHQLQFVRRADHILLLDKHGHELASGNVVTLTAEGHNIDDLLPQSNLRSLVSVDVSEATDSESIIPKDRKTSLIEPEKRQLGAVTLHSYVMYLRQFGSLPYALFIFSLFAFTQALQIGVDWYLSYWMSLATEDRERDRYLGIYAALVGLFMIIAFARMVLFMAGSARASQKLHDLALTRLLSVSMRFFDTQPLGRILNRFRWGGGGG